MSLQDSFSAPCHILHTHISLWTFNGHGHVFKNKFSQLLFGMKTSHSLPLRDNNYSPELISESICNLTPDILRYVETNSTSTVESSISDYKGNVYKYIRSGIVSVYLLCNDFPGDSYSIV